jgi:hypothetical protein
MMFNATFNNISVILWRSVLLEEETGGLGENHRGSQLYFHIARFMLKRRREDTFLGGQK